MGLVMRDGINRLAHVKKYSRFYSTICANIARVGFSIATAVDPDILLLDEVLQTGDNKFKEKSRLRIAEVLQTAKAVVMVTHDMSWITAFCTRAILLDKGQIVAEGDPDEIAEGLAIVERSMKGVTTGPRTTAAKNMATIPTRIGRSSWVL